MGPSSLIFIWLKTIYKPRMPMYQYGNIGFAHNMTKLLTRTNWPSRNCDANFCPKIQKNSDLTKYLAENCVFWT